MAKKGYVQEEATWVVRARDISGIIALVGVGILGGFSLTNLIPAWLHQDENSGSASPDTK